MIWVGRDFKAHLNPARAVGREHSTIPGCSKPSWQMKPSGLSTIDYHWMQRSHCPEICFWKLLPPFPWTEKVKLLFAILWRTEYGEQQELGMLRVPRDVDSLLCLGNFAPSIPPPFKGRSNPVVAGIPAPGLLLLPSRPFHAEGKRVNVLLEL